MVSLGEAGLLKGKRSAEVLDVAFEMFACNAIESVSMTDIADEAKIGVATIYRYFGTKQQLVICTVAREWERRAAVVKQRYEERGVAEQSGYEQLSFLIMNMVEDYQDLQSLYHLSGNVDQYLLHEQVSDEACEPYRNAVRPLFDMLYHCFDKGIEDGSISSGMSDRTHQAGGILSIMGAAQKYASGGVFGLGDIETHQRWLRNQARTYLYFMAHFDELHI